MSSQSSCFFSETDTSVQSPRRNVVGIPYFNLNDDKNREKDAHLKLSLAHYFSSIFVVFVALLLIGTIALFIRSNSSIGVRVSLQVSPILPSESSVNTDISNYNAWNALRSSSESNHKTDSESSLVFNHDYRSIAVLFDDYDLMMNGTNNSVNMDSISIPDISDLKLNVNICFVLCFISRFLEIIHFGNDSVLHCKRVILRFDCTDCVVSKIIFCAFSLSHSLTILLCD